MSRGTHDGFKKLMSSGTASDMINAVGYSSQTWSCKEDEKFGKAKLSEAHARQGAARTAMNLANQMVDMEQETALRDAAAKQKRKLDNELNELLAEQQQTKTVQPEAKIAKPTLKTKQDSKPSRPLGLLVVKKGNAGADSADAVQSKNAKDEKANPGAAPVAPAGDTPATTEPASSGGGIGLGAYGSSSESSDDDNEDGE
eukprot:TRINITY_DN18689_c0_g1_i1.p1 TRINITY_DN18689_c0_g1~~TRINITY_DN18689_c0_g1_i1.p1  ORF type:complete len:200 (+),score=49.30 TRINITY_DN18689_c0_g1_i1:62-661(+)